MVVREGDKERRKKRERERERERREREMDCYLHDVSRFVVDGLGLDSVGQEVGDGQDHRNNWEYVDG